MENGWSWEQKTLVSELMQGMELAKQLKAQLGTSSAETKELLVRQILSSYEKALLILKWSGSSIQPQTAAGTSGVPESPISANGSPQSDDFDGAPKDNPERKDCSKKRKILPRWTNQVRVSSETGLEGSHDDGYSWRKYGQKDILGAKYPRSEVFSLILFQSVTPRTAGLQSRCRDQMKIPWYSKSLTGEHTPVHMATREFSHQHHQKN